MSALEQNFNPNSLDIKKRENMGRLLKCLLYHV